MRPTIFFGYFPKILFLKGLRVDDMSDPSQNLELLGLARKILSNNDLQSCRKSRPRLSAGSRIGQLGCGTQGQMSHHRRAAVDICARQVVSHGAIPPHGWADSGSRDPFGCAQGRLFDCVGASLRGALTSLRMTDSCGDWADGRFRHIPFDG